MKMQMKKENTSMENKSTSYSSINKRNKIK